MVDSRDDVLSDPSATAKDDLTFDRSRSCPDQYGVRSLPTSGVNSPRTTRGGTGGVEHGVVGQQTFTKAIVVVAVERPGIGRYGRIRLARLPDKTAPTLHAFVLANVAAGSTIIADGHKGYLGLDKRGYTLTQVPIKASGFTGSELLPGVHLVASHLDPCGSGLITARSADATSTPISGRLRSHPP